MQFGDVENTRQSKSFQPNVDLVQASGQKGMLTTWLRMLKVEVAPNCGMAGDVSTCFVFSEVIG